MEISRLDRWSETEVQRLLGPMYVKMVFSCYVDFAHPDPAVGEEGAVAEVWVLAESLTVGY